MDTLQATPEQIADMRGWIADCAWGDLDADEIASLSDTAVLRGVARHYVGGVAAFLADSAA